MAKLRCGGGIRTVSSQFALKLTTAGMKAAAGLAGGDGNASRKQASSKAEREPSRTERASQVDEAKIEEEPPATSRAAPRSGTKIDGVLQMLDRPEGATLASHGQGDRLAAAHDLRRAYRIAQAWLRP